MGKTMALPNIKFYGIEAYCEIIVEFNDSRKEVFNIKNIIVDRVYFTVFISKILIDVIINNYLDNGKLVAMDKFINAIIPVATHILIEAEFDSPIDYDLEIQRYLHNLNL